MAFGQNMLQSSQKSGSLKLYKPITGPLLCHVICVESKQLVKVSIIVSITSKVYLLLTRCIWDAKVVYIFSSVVCQRSRKMTTCRTELLETVLTSAWVQSMSACTLANRCSEDSSLNSGFSSTSAYTSRALRNLLVFNRLSAGRRAHCPSTSVYLLPSLGIIRRSEGLKAHPNPMLTNNLSKKMHQSVDFWSAFED